MTIPSDLSGLLFWYKADAITGLTNGASLTSWPDSGPNGWNITTISGTAPTWTASAINGLPCVSFGGAGYLKLPAAALGAFANKPGGSCYVVGRVPTTTHAAFFMHASSGAGANPARYNQDHPSGATSPHGVEGGGRRLDTDSVVTATINAAAADSTWHVESSYLDWTNNKIGERIDGGSWTTVTAAWASGGGNSDTTNSTEIDIGGNPGVTPTSVAMDIEEIFAFSRVLTATEQQQMDTYLSNRTLIPVADFAALPATIAASTSVPTPTVTVAGNATVSVSAITASTNVPAPTVSAVNPNATAAAAAIAATTTVPAATVIAGGPPVISGAQVTVDTVASFDRTLTAPTGAGNGDRVLTLIGGNGSKPTVTLGWNGTTGTGQWVEALGAAKTSSTGQVDSFIGAQDSTNLSLWKAHLSGQRAWVWVTAKMSGGDPTVADWKSHTASTGSGSAVNISINAIAAPTTPTMALVLVTGPTGATDPVSLPDGWTYVASGTSSGNTSAAYFAVFYRNVDVGETPADQTFTFGGTGGVWEALTIEIPQAPIVDTTITASAITAATTVPAPTVSLSATAAPNAINATTSVPAPVVTSTSSLTNVAVVQGWSTANTGNTSSGSASVVLPNTPAQGNVLVIAANADQPVATPAGWTPADSLVNVCGLYLFTKVAGAAEPSTISVTFSGVGAIAVAELTAATGALDASTGQVTRTSGSAPIAVSMSAPTGSADEYVVAVMGSISAAQLQWAGWASGFTEQADTSTTLTAGNNVSVAVADYDLRGPAAFFTSAATYDRSTGALAASAAQALLVAFQAVPGSATVRAPTTALSGTMPAPAIVVPINATVTPPVIAVGTTVPGVVPSTPGSTVVPAATIVAATRVPSIASSTASSTVFVDPVAATTGVPAAVSVAGTPVTTVTPGAVTANTTVPAPVIGSTSALNATVPAQTVTAATSVPGVTLTVGTSVTVAPNAYAALAAILTPTAAANSVAVAARTITALTSVSTGNASITIPTYMFTPPTVFDVPQIAVGVSSPMNRLAMHMNAGERGQSVWVLKDGTYTTQQPVYWEDVDHVFYGGHQYTVSAAEAALLTANGFTVTEATP